MSKETHLNAFGYSHRNKGKWGGPKRAPVLQEVVRVALGRTTWIVPLPTPALQPLPQDRHLQSCTTGRRGKPLPRAGEGAALMPLRALPRAVWAEAEGLEAVGAGGAAGSVLSPLSHGRVRWGTGGQAAWICKLPGALRGRCFWNSEQRFGSSGQSGLGADEKECRRLGPGRGRAALVCQVQAAGYHTWGVP